VLPIGIFDSSPGTPCDTLKFGNKKGATFGKCAPAG
jgi:hypothetical protein